MAKTRVLYVDHATAVGGGERSLLELTAALDRDRYETVFALAGPGPFADILAARGEQVSFYNASRALLTLTRGCVAPWSAAAWRRAGDLATTVRNLRRLVAAAAPDIIHTNSQKAHVCGALASVGTSTPFLVHMRDILTPRFARGVVDLLAATRATRVLAISQAVARRFAWARRKVTVVYNAVAEPEATSPAAVRLLRAAWELPAGVRVAGCVGQVAPWKGQHIFVEMARRLAPDVPNLYFVIVGGPIYGATAYYDTLRARVVAAGLEDRFRWVGQHPDAAPLIAALDALVHVPVEEEPFGRVVVEAMARGVPVVAAATGALPELVTAGEEGLLCRPDDADDAAASLHTLLTDRAVAAAMGQRGRATFQRRFRVKRLAEEVAAVYDDLRGNFVRRRSAAGALASDP